MGIINTQVYPRVIQLMRQATNAGAADATIGLTGYSGAEAAPAPVDPQGRFTLATGIPASIQAGPTGRKKDSALPQDVVFMPTWFILIPLSALAKGMVRDRDMIVDDENYVYEVGQAYWNRLGWKLICIRMEA